MHTCKESSKGSSSTKLAAKSRLISEARGNIIVSVIIEKFKYITSKIKLRNLLIFEHFSPRSIPAIQYHLFQMTIGCLQPFILMICLPLATWTELNFLTSVFTQFIPVLPLLYPYCIIYLPQVHCLTLNYDVFQVLCTQDPTKAPGVESVIGDLWSWFKTYLTAC